MIEILIDQLIDVWNKHGNMGIGFLDENGVLRSFKGFTILPKHSTIVKRNDFEEVEESFHMKTKKDKTLVLF